MMFFCDGNHNNFSLHKSLELGFGMADSLIKVLLQKAWREQWSVENWATEIGKELACLTGRSRRDFLSVLTGECWLLQFKAPGDKKVRPQKEKWLKSFALFGHWVETALQITALMNFKTVARIVLETL